MKQIIIDTYPTYGIRETVNRLGLTTNEQKSVQSMAQTLKLKRIGKYYTDEDITFLKTNYSSMSVDAIAKSLGKDKSAIISKASELNLRNDIFFYSESDIQFLKNNYNYMRVQDIADKIHKTYSSVTEKANKLNLSNGLWSEEELNILKNVYPYYSNSKIAKEYLPKRNKDSINRMAYKLNFQKSIDFHRTKYDKEESINKLSEIAIEIGRAPFTYELKQYNLPSEKTYSRYFNSYENACQLANAKRETSLFGKSYHLEASDGAKCLSKAEKTITEFLITNKIDFEKEPYYKDYINDERCLNKRFDWKSGNYPIEYFGMPEKEYYKARMEEKISICKDNNINLICLYRKDLKKLEEVLHILL